MRVDRVTRSFNAEGEPESEQVRLMAVYSDDPQSENAQWSKWTPSASFEITINNPKAFGTLARDHEFYVDFTPANTSDKTGV